MTERVQFIAYAYEARVGDQLDGRKVTAVEDQSGTVTITFAGADEPEQLERLAEVTIARDRSEVFD